MAYKIKKPKKSNVIYEVDIFDKDTDDTIESELFDTEKQAEAYAKKQKKSDNYIQINKADRETGSFDI